MALQSFGDYSRDSTIYRSTNFGFTWFPLNAPSNHWWGVACSGDGTRIVACAPHAAITLSTDSGATWSLPSIPDGPWDTITYSADGTRIITTVSDADVYNSPLAISADSGATWSITNLRIWGFRAACSVSGQNIINGAYSGVDVSQDFGATWRLTGLPTNLWWRAVASSADGTRLIAALNDYSLRTTNAIYTPSDAGQTWVLNDAPNTNWISVASSADGCKLVAAVGMTMSGFIYRAQRVPQPVLKTRLSGANLVLSWIVPSAPFVLQETDDITNPNWSALPSVPVLNTSTLENEVTVPLRTGNSFYRLKGIVN